MAAAAVSIKAKPPPLGLTDQQQQQQCRHICRAVTNNNWGKVRPVTCNICKLCFTIAAAPTNHHHHHPHPTSVPYSHFIRPWPPKVLADSGHLSHCLMVGQLLPWQSLNRNRRLRRHPPQSMFIREYQNIVGERKSALLPMRKKRTSNNCMQEEKTEKGIFS